MAVSQRILHFKHKPSSLSHSNAMVYDADAAIAMHPDRPHNGNASQIKPLLSAYWT